MSSTIKAWKLNLKNYPVSREIQNPETGSIEMVEIPYDVKRSIASLLFHPDLKLTVDQSFEAKDLADRIRSAENEIAVDSREMEMLRKAYSVMRSPDEDSLECFRRIKDAKEIEVEEKGK